MSKTIILDLDGTLLDGQDRHYRCYSDILLSLGGRPLSPADYWQNKRKGLKADQLLAFSGDADKIEPFSKAWLEMIEDKKYLVLDRLYPQVTTVLDYWQKAGILLYLATLRKHVAHLYWQLEQLDLSRYFEDITIAYDATEKAELIKQKLPAQPRMNMLWIGDSEVDAKAARLLNMPVCLLSCGLRNEEFLRELAPDHLEENLVSFAQKMRFME